MADFKKYLPKLLVYEGGYVDNPNDKGGPTKYGITLNEWIAEGYDKNGDYKVDAEDVKLITKEEAGIIAKREYWDHLRGDEINTQEIAEILVDWAYTSGTSIPLKRVQKILGLKDDGIMGPKTLQAINVAPQQPLFNLIKALRITFYKNIVINHPSQRVFLKGWINRVNQFTWPHP